VSFALNSVPQCEMTLQNTMAGRNFPQRWVALRVRPRCEKRVGFLLRQQGFEELVPLYTSRRRWSDRYKNVELPLFPGYVFCRLAGGFQSPVLSTPGVLHFVGIGRKPSPVEEHEIEAIRLIVGSTVEANPCPFLEAGDRVRIISGPLQSLEGVLIDVQQGHSLVVSVSLLQRSIAVKVEPSWVIAETPRFRAQSARIETRRTA
jgi:transcription antitermination factor NusG